jgi:hypothetical protein
MAAREGQGQLMPQSSRGGEGKLNNSSILVDIYLTESLF